MRYQLRTSSYFTTNLSYTYSAPSGHHDYWLLVQLHHRLQLLSRTAVL